MTPPLVQPVGPLPPTSSVARSLANAAAALRAQEWRGTEDPDDINNANVSASRHSRWARNTDENTGLQHGYIDEDRDLTHRQRVAREFYDQNLQSVQWRQPQQGDYRYDEGASISEMTHGYTAAKRQKVNNNTDQDQLNFRYHPTGSTEAAAIWGRPSSSTVQLASSRAGAEVVDPVMMEQQRVQLQRTVLAGPTFRPTSVGRGTRAPLPGLVAGPGSIQVPDVGKLGSARRSNSAGAGIPVESEDNNAQKVPPVVEDIENDVDGDDADEDKPKKRVRYLRDTDRRNIIKRIENGEKQAALAREFGVTRAAICHIKKNRFEILSRYNMLVKSAQEIDRAESFEGPPGVEMMVHEVRANSVLLLMTMLRDSRSSGVTFRRVAGRLIMILLEEALAILGTESVEVITGTGHVYRGLELRHQFCGVSIGSEGFPFLVLFHQMEPEAPQGSINVVVETDRQGQRVWRLDHMDLPVNIVQHKVLLFSSTCSTGDTECKAIEALCSVGCDEGSISLVVLLTASNGIVKIDNRFPQVKIITGGIDGKVDPQTDSIVPGLGDFVSRYNGS